MPELSCGPSTSFVFLRVTFIARPLVGFVPTVQTHVLGGTYGPCYKHEVLTVLNVSSTGILYRRPNSARVRTVKLKAFLLSNKECLLSRMCPSAYDTTITEIKDGTSVLRREERNDVSRV
jgi:hypothetical protein